MSTIKVTCIDQTMALTSTPVITSGGVHEDIVEFDFCPLWDGYTRTAVFWRTADDPIFRVLDEKDTCEVPAEVLIAEGAFHFGAFGVNAEGVQRTTGVLRYNVAPGVLRAGLQPADPAPDIYVQLLAGYAGLEAVVRENVGITEAAAQRAEAAAAVAVQAVPNTRTINDQSLDKDINLDAAAVGALAALPHLASERLGQIAFGSYVGRGTCGEENPNTLEFDFAPRVVMLISQQTNALAPDFLSIRWMVRPLPASSWKSEFNTGTTGAVSWGDDGKSVSWWVQPTGVNTSSGPSAQMNTIDKTYYWLAIG